MVQLVSTGDQGLAAIYLGYGDGATIWARRSRDGGARWDDAFAIVDEDAFKAEIHSLAAACDTRRDQTFLAFATGKANHRIHLSTGRNGARNWSKAVEVTAMVKKPGWNVILGGQGVSMNRSRDHDGRIVMPMQAGDEGYDLYMIYSDDSGRSWKRVGPIVESYKAGCELMEDEQGILWAAIRSSGGEGGARMILSSQDGGETWSEPMETTMKDAHARGSMVAGLDHARKPVWYYASSDVIHDENSGSMRTHLSLYGSRDRGKTWKELKRVHYGNWSYPTVVPLGPNRCGITLRRESHSSNAQQIRFIAVGDLWGASQ